MRLNSPKFNFFTNPTFQLVNFMYVCNVKQKRHDYGNGKQKIPCWDTDFFRDQERPLSVY